MGSRASEVVTLSTKTKKNQDETESKKAMKSISRR